MSFLVLPSGKSLWRGYEYYKDKKVKSIEYINESIIKGIVQGEKQYNVTIDIKHPTRSVCDCPLAKDKKIICKHKVGLYFEAFPAEAERYYNEVIEAEAEEEEYYNNLYDRVIKYVKTMSKSHLQNELIDILSDYNNEYIYDRFVKDHDLY